MARAGIYPLASALGVTSRAAVVAFVLLSAMGCGDDLSEARMASYSSSDSCLARNDAAVQEYGDSGEAEVEITVDGLTVHVVHKNAVFNCCLDTIVVDFSQDGELLTLREREETTTPCDCVCPFEVTATIEVPRRGTYILEIYSGAELVWRAEVKV